MYLPEAFQKKMKAILGEEYDDFLAGFEKPRHYGLRVNTAKITVEEFKELVPFHLTQIPWVENGFYYEEEDAPTRHPYYYAGLYYIQEPSAMTTASRLPVGPGERVLDLCAAPGGKATELGAKLFGEGLLVANDISASRVKALLKNIEVMGIPNSFLLNEVPAKIAEQFPAYFDKILVDAPCSGEGMFRKNPEAARVWSEEKPPECAKMQREIVKQAISMLKPGGMMIYSTCTFSPEENEQIIAWVLREFPEMQLIPMKGYEGFSEGRPDLADGNPELKKCVRIWPHHMDGEGHFVALMQKRRTPEMDDISPEKASAYISEADEEPSDHDDVKKKKKKEFIKRCEYVQLHGCFMLFSRKYIEKFNGLDDRTFLYREEAILMKHLTENGLNSVYLPDIHVFHREDASTDDMIKENRKKEMFEIKNHLQSLKVLKEVYDFYENKRGENK